MDYGIMSYVTESSMMPQELAVEVEGRGFESLFFPEHTHIPAVRISRYPLAEEMPISNAHSLDPFVAISAAVVATKELKLGTGICLIVERDPIITAKAIASLDYLSRGRIIVGVGAGWNREEMRNHGTDPRHRIMLLGERVRAMKTIWANDEATFQGKYVMFDRIWSWPKPVQRPSPPVMIGGNGPSVIDRVLSYGDGWFPNDFADLRALAARIRDLHQRGVEGDRGWLPVTAFGAASDEPSLRALSRLGFDRVVFSVRSGDRADVIPELDRIALMCGL
ncbi:MAG: LLM class F420-dependent oxidoreductase [Acidimicrobiales bacterium]